MAEKNKQRRFYSDHVLPVGMAKFANLHEPHAFKAGDKPMYKTRTLLDDTPETRALLESIVEMALKEGKEDGLKFKKNYGVPYLLPEDLDEDDFVPEEGKDHPKYDEDHVGKIIIESKNALQPSLIDSQLQSIPDDVKIYGRDMIRIKVEARPYDGFGGGVSFRLKTVQLIAKDTAGAGGREVYAREGFDAVDGGYTAPPAVADDDEEF